MLFKAEYLLSHVTICTYSDQLWCEIVFPLNINQETKDSLDASQAVKTKSEADPETSLNNNNNAPKCLFPSLADTTDKRPEMGTLTPRNKMNLK